MKFVLIALLISVNAFAWEIKQEDKDFFIVSDKDRYQIFVDIGEPVFLEEKKLNDNITVLVYNAGEVGTQTLSVIHRCIVLKNGKYVDNVLYAVFDKGSKENTGTKWEISKEKVKLTKLDTGRTWSF